MTNVQRSLKRQREYRIWKAMKTRCYNPNYKGYQDYGGRGIVVCQRWRSNYPAFLADMGRCPPGYSIHRIDNDGPYSPDNCVWVDKTTQNRGRRITRHVEWRGATLPLGEACDEAGVDYGRARAQLARGLTFDQACRRLRDLDNARGGAIPAIRMCMKCFADLPLSEFHKSTSGQFGVKPYCRSCLSKKRARLSIASLARRHGVSVSRLRRRMVRMGMDLTTALADISADDRRSEPGSHKRCNICGLEKPLSSFHINRNGTAGRRAACRPCQNARSRELYRRRRLSQLQRES